MEFVIDRKKRKQTVTYMEYDLDGFSFTPRSSKNNLVKVSKVTIINKTMISTLVKDRIDVKFNQLFNVINSLIEADNDETDESDIYIVLDEIKKVEMMLESKYKNHLKMEAYKDYLDKLYYLNGQLTQKLKYMEDKYRKPHKSSHGRGR